MIMILELHQVTLTCVSTVQPAVDFVSNGSRVPTFEWLTRNEGLARKCHGGAGHAHGCKNKFHHDQVSE